MPNRKESQYCVYRIATVFTVLWEELLSRKLLILRTHTVEFSCGIQTLVLLMSYRLYMVLGRWVKA